MLEEEETTKAIETLLATWKHILLNGHYTFQSNSEIIDPNALVAGLKLR